MRWLYLFFIFFLASCDPKPPKPILFTVLGRGEIREPLYRLQTPPGWEALPLVEEAKFDTKEPLLILAKEGVEIHIHNFPAKTLEERIPPEAQVQRWLRQLPDKKGETVTPVTRGGFWGYLVEIEGEKEKIFAAAMQLDDILAKNLLQSALPQDVKEQMLADYTLKCKGASEALNAIEKDFLFIASSFELIRELEGD